MRIVFMGTPDFAVPILERVAADHDVVAVYARPDAASGRGSRLLSPPVKTAAERLGIPVRQPKSLRAPDVIAPLIADAPDVIVVAAYGVILPAEVLGIPVHGCVNVHASLLPRHRGAAPIQRAILEGDTETGVSIMRMEEGLDTGPFALSESLPIGDLDATALTTALSRIGVNALAEVLRRIEDGTVAWTPQDESTATYARKITREDVALDPSLTVAAAVRRVRASSPQARVRILAGDIDFVVVHAVPGTEPVPSGSARRTPEGLLLGVSNGTVLVDRMRPAGKSSVDGAAWSRGSRLAEDTPWHPA